MSGSTAVQAAQWRPSRLKSVLASLAYPIVFALNRPSMSWFGDMLYNAALRCNGIAITFSGSRGLTQAEENFLTRNKVRFQHGVLFDIGANHGAYALYLQALAPHAQILAFEPHPSTFSLLRSRLEGFASIQAVNKGVTDKAGSLKLYDFRLNDGSTQASLSESAVGLYSSDIVEHQVDCTTVDEYMAEAGFDHIDLLKVDTEGHDLSVLIGAKKAIQERRIGMIQFEFIPANIATGVTMRGFYEVLRGYRIGRLCLNGSVRWLDAYDVKRCEIYVTHNLIAVPVNQSI